MLSRSRMRFSIKSEDETAKNQRILSEKIQLKKQQIRAEFESFEIKQTYGFLSPGELKFKKELDDIRAKKQSKLQKLTFLSNLLICKPDFNDPENKYSAQSLFSLNPDPEILREKLQSSILELKKVESNIESQVMNENSIKSKIEEFIRGINLFKRQNFEMRYLCNLSEKRFKYLDVIRFNAKTKEVKSKANFSKIKKDITEINLISKDFLQIKYNLTKNTKNKLKEEEDNLTFIMISIDEAKKHLAKTHEQIQILLLQEDEIRLKRLGLLDMEDHLHVFDDLERIFINNDPIDVLASLLSPNMNMEELDIILKKLQNNQNNEESNPKYKKIHSLHMQTSIKKEKNDVLRSETRTFVFMNSEKKFDEEDEKDRLNIRGKLEDYYIRHSDGPLPLITKLIKVFKEMNFFSSSLQSQYQELIKLKNQRGKDLEFYNSHLHEFLDKNHKSEEDIKIITNEEELNGYGIIDQEDFNLPALQIKPNSNITTVNVIKNYVNSRSKTDDLIAQNKELISFFIKLYSTLIFITKRLCKTIGLIGEISKEIPNILLEHTQSVLKKLDINFHSPIILARKGSETLKSSSKNVFNFSEIVENDNKMDTIWSLSTPKTLKNLLVERNESEKQIELTNLKFLEKKTNVRKFISELFDNESEESLNCLHKFIKESLIMNSMPNQWIIEEAFKNFIKELGLVKPYDIKIVISSFFYVENKAFEIMCEKMNLLCNLYRDYLLKIMDFKAETKLSFNSFKNSLGQPDLKKLIEAPNNKFIKAINSQVCLKIQSFTNNPLELNEKENLDAKETEENNESDDEDDSILKTKKDFLILEKINKMARKDLKKSINSSIRLKNDSEVVDEARAMHRKLITIEKNLKNEEEALEFEREKIKNPEISAYLAKKTLQNDPKYLNSFEKNSLRQKIEYKDGASQNIMKDFNSDLAYVTKLKKIDRENTIVENVKHLHFNYKVDKLKKKSNFKQNEVFENDSKKFHFLTTTKAFESSKVDKFQRNSDYLYSTGSLFHKTPKHQRAQTSYRIKPVNICKQSSEHVKMLLKIAENKINSCKSESLMQRYQTETPFSLQNNDYSVLFTYDNSKDL